MKMIGNVGNEPVTSAEGKKPFASFDVCTTKHYTKGEESVSEPHWHKVKCYGKLAEIAAKHISKGTRVFVDGEVLNDPWTDKDGVIHKGYCILANKIIALDKKSDSPVAAEEK